MKSGAELRYAEDKAQIKSDLMSHGNQFLNKGSRKKPFSERTPKDYIPNWRGIPAGDNFEKKTVVEIFKDTGHGGIYEKVYSPASVGCTGIPLVCKKQLG